MINNAGIATAHTILDTSEEFLEKLFRVNLFSHWITIKEFLPAMLDAKKGHIVSIASMASYFSGCGLVDYAATKAGVLALHEGTSSEIFNTVFYCLLYCKLTSSTQRSQPRTQTPIQPERPLHSDLHRAPHVGSNASCKGLAGVSCCIEDVRLATFGSL